MGKKRPKQEDDLTKIHRFQSFSERIANIRINVAHKVTHVADSAEETETFFGEGLAKWRELNCTTDFVTFSRETHKLLGTLPQLIHHKDEIAAKLKHSLQLQHTLAYEPLLDLLVQFARDLQAEFYTYFKDFFPILVAMTDTQDADVIQCVFTSLAYLFKFLWRHMIKDIEAVFTMHSKLLLLNSVKAHIRQFAVESFGFLLRKVRDHNALFDMIFRQLSDNPEMTDGVGQLLFEMCRGVSNQLHSCTDSVLPLLLSKLGPEETVFEALSKMMQLMAEHTRKEFAGPLWKPLLNHLASVCGHGASEELWYCLHLIGILVSWRKGSRITDLGQLVEVIVGILLNTSLDQQTLSVAVHLAASLILVMPHIPHTHTPLTSLVRAVTSVGVMEKWQVETVVQFFQELAEKYQGFNSDIFGECMTFCNSVIQNGRYNDLVIKFLAELCLHFNPQRYTLNSGSKQPLPFLIDFEQPPLWSVGKRSSERGGSVVPLLVESVSSWRDCMEGVSEQLWAVLLLLKHIRPCPDNVLGHLLDLYCHLSGQSVCDQLLLSQCVSTIVALCDSTALMEKLTLAGLLELLRRSPGSLPLLSSVEEYLRAQSEGDAPEALSSDWLMQFLATLQDNLSSPHTLVRLVTLRILCCFEQPPLVIVDHPLTNMLELCLRAEETSTHLNIYRRKILWFQKLQYSPVMSPLLPDGYNEVSLRYLIGSLYINFSLIWDPLIEIIGSYAFGENMKSFWNVFGTFLEKSSDIAEGVGGVVQSGSDDAMKWHSSVEDLFRYWNRKLDGMECGRVDHANFRLLLWKCVAGLKPSIAEPRSRILVPLVLRFVKNEYSLQEDNLMEMQDLRKESQQLTLTEAGVANSDSKALPEQNIDSSSHRKTVYKTLVIMLTAFSKFKNAKTFYRQEELKQLCMKLLTHKLPEVQKLALTCLMTYKPSYLLPYRENFERILEDESFREELSSFSSDSSCSIVSSEHREHLLPVLVRLLHGRMQRLGSHESSRTGGSSRQGTVLRFLGGCEEGEMTEFIKLLTLPFQELKNLPESSIECGVKPGHVIPLKKQQGFLNMLGQMFSTVGQKMKHYLNIILPILLNLGVSCTTLLSQRNEIQPHFVNALKALRQLILGRVSECFDVFLDYDFGEYMESVLGSLVWPQLPRLPQECVQSPTALLKLLHTWTLHSQYFYLLNTPLPPSVLRDAPSTCVQSSILGFVYSCLCSHGVSASVCDYILQMTLNLLSDDIDSSGDGPGAEMARVGDSPGAEMARVGDGPGADLEMARVGDGPGAEMVVPHTTEILKYLQRSIQENLKQDKQGASLQLAFSLLSKISAFVNNPAQSRLLVQLLLPFLTKASYKYKKFEKQILLALNKLIGFCEDVPYRPFSELFGTLKDRQSRALLCDIFKEIAKKESIWCSTAAIVYKLNAWDTKRIDEPDYDQRLEGFKEATERISVLGTGGLSWSCDLLETTLPIVHNVLFFLMEAEDMSIRDGAASCTSSLINHITLHDSDAFKTIILGTTLSAIKQGLRSKTEFARIESISVLSLLVKSYPTHSRFSDLVALSHHEAEADFFENVKHIQLHRRTRAFRKLASVCSEGGVSQAAYMWFLLPLANQVVFKPASNTEQNLLAEAVNVIAAISMHLNWTNYSFILTHYLRQLSKQIEIQRSLVKAVVAVLDNFHFDLSSVTHEDTQAIKPHPTATPGDAKHPHPAENVEEAVQETREDEVKEDEAMEDGESLPTPAIVDKDEATVSKNTARKILKTIIHTIIPNLQKVLTKRIDVAGHKLSSLGQNDDSEILRVPIAMAMTKLLLALPEESLHSHLPSLLLKVCQTLKNRSREVRDVGRGTLVKMAPALGPRYLQYIIKEMRDALDRGYMLHVLGYSLHSVLRGLSPHLISGDLDPCLELVSCILTEDLFGTPAEEREVGAKIPEAKTPQSFNSYEIMGTYLSPTRLPDLLLPVKQRLEGGASAHTLHAVEEVFRRVGLGIHSNQALSPQALLVLVHGLLSDSVPQLSSKPTRPVRVATKPAPSLRPPDSRLLPPTPQRTGAKTVAVSNTAANVVSEFGLQLFHTALKRGKFDTSSEPQLAMLDPFVPLIVAALSSRHIMVISRGLQCMVWLLRLPLPSLPSAVEELSTKLFELLRQYARAGAAMGANRELVLSAFKAMTVIVRDCKKHTVSEDELKLLLSFVEEDIHDYQRQSTAFPLLKAILGRKLVVTEVYDVMMKVCQLSVTSDSEHVRQQCRQSVLMFLMDYPLGKKLNRYLDFYVSNLSYEGQSGRESVLEMFSSMFTKFPEKMVQRHSSYFFVPLASQLINDESPTCRQMVGHTIKLLFGRLDSSRINDVTSILNVWIESDNILHKRLGMQALGILIEVEGQNFEKRVSTYLPQLIDCLTLYDPNYNEGDLIHKTTVVKQSPERIIESSAMEENASTVDDFLDNLLGDEEMDTIEETSIVETVTREDSSGKVEAPGSELVGGASLDHLLFTALSTIRKLCGECSLWRGPKDAHHMTRMWGVMVPLLLHPHAWVRLAASQLFGLLFTAYTPDELVSMAMSGSDATRKKTRRSQTGETPLLEYIVDDTLIKIQELSHSFCTQLWSPILKPDLANQAVKNLVFCAKVLHRFNTQTDHPSSVREEDTPAKDLSWLIRQLSRLARFEAGHHPKLSRKRTCVLQWTAAVCVYLGAEQLPDHLPSLLGPIYRELSDSSKRAGEELYSLAQEVVELMKGVCGREAFSSAYAQVHQSVGGVRDKRRMQAALEAVANPEKTIRRKRKKNELKKAAKKMKILRIRPDSTAAALFERQGQHKHDAM